MVFDEGQDDLVPQPLLPLQAGLKIARPVPHIGLKRALGVVREALGVLVDFVRDGFEGGDGECAQRCLLLIRV